MQKATEEIQRQQPPNIVKRVTAGHSHQGINVPVCYYGRELGIFLARIPLFPPPPPSPLFKHPFGNGAMEA